MMKILSVFGTRPEAIKMAPLVKAISKDKAFHSKICVTAQHREMLDQVLDIFEIKPDYDLNLMEKSQDLYDITSRILINLRDVLKEYQPDLVLVHGDTATTFAAALAAFYQQIPVGHVEAGLRTGNLYSPWPEEANRVLTSRLASLHFAPTERNHLTLLKEGIPEKLIRITGNTIIDALKWVVKKIDNSPDLKVSIENRLLNSGLDIKVIDSKFILITGHRRENFGAGFKNICVALRNLSIKNPDVSFIYPVHLNPNVQDPVRKILGGLKNFYLIEPLGYESFIYLMKNSYLIITDSGGIQEEAPSLGKPVLVMRSSTERPEAVDAGTVKLVGTDVNAITAEVQDLIDNRENIYDFMSKAHNPYGNGNSSNLIIKAIKEFNKEI